MKNIERKPDYNQVVVWPGTLIKLEQLPEFKQFILDELGTRAQYLETILTAPDMTDGSPVEDTGGRSDVFFAIHKDDINHFALKRLALGMRWIEDAISEVNGGCVLYPERVKGYCHWDTEEDDEVRDD